MEQRKSARKLLRIKATLTMDGAEPKPVNTVDVGKFGMCLVNIQQQIPMGQHVHVAFDILFAGKVHKVNVAARIAYCLYSEGEGHRAGLQFLDLESEAAIIIAQYVGM